MSPEEFAEKHGWIESTRYRLNTTFIGEDDWFERESDARDSIEIEEVDVWVHKTYSDIFEDIDDVISFIEDNSGDMYDE